jgi:hypothetical protein
VPAYSSRTVALALGVKPKELDNLLSRSAVRGVSGGISGRNRRITGDAISVIAIAAELRRAFGSPWHQALETAEMLALSETVQLANGLLTLSVSLSRYRERLNQRLDEVAEYVVTPSRGRPRPSRSNPRRGSDFRREESEF